MFITQRVCRYLAGVRFDVICCIDADIVIWSQAHAELFNFSAMELRLSHVTKFLVNNRTRCCI